MSMLKRYLENLLHQATDQAFGQDAIEWAILSGRFVPSLNLEADVKAIHAVAPDVRKGTDAAADITDKPLTRYDQFIDEYRAEQQSINAALLDSYAGIIGEILAPAPRSRRGDEADLQAPALAA